MHSLRERAKDGKASQWAQPAKGKAKAKKKFTLLDLDGNDDDEDDNDDGGSMEQEKKFHEQLERSLTRCQLCGPTKFCQISRSGQHINLSFQQRRGWAVALVNFHSFECTSHLSKIHRLSEHMVLH